MLQWVVPRQEPIRALKADELTTAHDLDSDEVKFLALVAGSSDTFSAEEQSEADRFWAMASLILPLADWGNHVTNWLHACPCPKPCKQHRCAMKGRRSIDMACGRMNELICKLNAVGVSQKAGQLMRSLGNEVRSTLLTEFNTAKSCMHLRVTQSFSFWQQRPWSILRIGECLTAEAHWDSNWRLALASWLLDNIAINENVNFGRVVGS